MLSVTTMQLKIDLSINNIAIALDSGLPRVWRLQFLHETWQQHYPEAQIGVHLLKIKVSSELTKYLEIPKYHSEMKHRI